MKRLLIIIAALGGIVYGAETVVEHFATANRVLVFTPATGLTLASLDPSIVIAGTSPTISAVMGIGRADLLVNSLGFSTLYAVPIGGFPFMVFHNGRLLRSTGSAYTLTAVTSPLPGVRIDLLEPFAANDELTVIYR